MQGIEKVTCERDQILNQQVIQSIVTRPSGIASIFAKGVDAIGYALYNAAAIFINHSGRDIAHATYR
ncbi:hypothetical protein SE18013_15150 [Escherichia coli O157:H7]|nr:hypothetical protein SE18013_15150 [Escherichia coli O157:H7]GHJ68617.1 hypothetical protein SE18017_23290 [Escherichia coli O157:H7]